MLAMIVTMSSLVAALFAGTGVAVGLLICCLSGAIALVAGALWVGYHPGRRGRGRASPTSPIRAGARLI